MEIVACCLRVMLFDFHLSFLNRMGELKKRKTHIKLCVVFNIQAQYTSFRFFFYFCRIFLLLKFRFLFLFLISSLIFIVIVSVLITNKKWHCRVLNTARDLEVESVGVNLIPWCKSRFWLPSLLGNINNKDHKKYTHFDK